jgi:hypothetical protein
MALAGALYKTVGTAGNNDAEEKELEEKEFRSLFPDVYAKYHDLMVVEDSVEEEELRMRLEREASSATKKEEGEEGEEGEKGRKGRKGGKERKGRKGRKGRRTWRTWKRQW